jgi:parallel beta-helix repeat protein
MTKRLAEILFFFIAFFFLFFPANAISQIADLFSQGATIIQVHPGEKIQSVIDKAKSGTVILVSSGTYYETVKMKDNITLKSERGASETIIDAQGADRPVVIGADKSVLDGFTVTGRGSGTREDKKGIHAIDCTNVSPIIRNCIIRDNDSTGINIRGKKAAPLIAGNNIYKNAAAGIGNDEDSRARIAENELYQNGLSGIGCEKGAHPVIEKNLTYENGFAGIGIRGAGLPPTVRNNECYRNERAGIGVEKGASPIIEGNKIFKNGRAGVGIDTSSTAFIAKNIISKNTLSGICVKSESNATIVENEISFNIMAGLAVLDHSQVKIEKNKFLENGTQGIIITNSRSTVTNNLVEGNHHHGVGLYANAFVLMVENMVKDNGAEEKRGAGIIMVGTDNVQIRQNTLENNYGPGVQTRVCSPLITENYFVNDSVFVRSRSGPTIKNNTFTSYGKINRKSNTGVNIRNFSFPLITNNVFWGFFGVNIRRSSKAIVVENIFSGSHKGSISSGRSGIKVSVRSSPVILRNVFYNENRIMIKGRSIRENIDPAKVSRRVKRIRKKRKKTEIVVQDNLFL